MAQSSFPRPKLDSLRQIDLVCDLFEADWQLGKSPRLEDYLKKCLDEDQPELRRHLEHLQQELARKNSPPLSLGRQTASLRHDGVTNDTVTDLDRAQDKLTTTKPPVGNGVLPKEATVESRSVNAVAAEDAASGNAEVIVLITDGPHSGQEFIFREYNTLLIGRSIQAQLRLQDDPRISRHHFRLEINPPRCYLIDLHSSNGTFVNDNRVAECLLKDGDTISIGRTKLIVRMKTGENNVDPQKPFPLRKGGDLQTQSPSSQEFSSHAERIPGYRLGEVTGTTALGSLYRATHLRSGRPCAMKIVTPDVNTGEQATRKFLREVEVLQKLHHPHIVRLLESGQSQGEIFLAMESIQPIPWGTLSEGWRDAKKFQLTSGLIIQVLSALEHAHSLGFVHRDINPETILFTRKGQKLVAKITDFSFAKNFTNAGMSQMTRHGDVVGSLAYMAPEQFINSRDALPSSDLYAVAATMFWMLTGDPPIAIDQARCKFLAILEEPPMTLQSRYKDAPSTLCEWIARGLEKDPAKRFSSAKEMKDHLRKIVGPGKSKTSTS